MEEESVLSCHFGGCFDAFSIWIVAAGAGAQVLAQNASPAPSAIKLTPYTAPDQSVSAGLPAGWKVTKGEQTVVVMTGSQGETISFGNTIVARNAGFQPGQRASGGVDMSMPNAANLAQKFTMILRRMP